MTDLDAFEERAAIMELDGGLSRFRAETLAAQAQGKQRREMLDAVSARNLAGTRDRGSEVDGQHGHALPAVQRASEEEARALPQRDVQAGRGAVDVPPLRMEGR